MVRYGILGAGNIARRFAASLAHETHAELVAVSRRSEEKAREFLDQNPCAADARAYGSHEALLADPAVRDRRELAREQSWLHRGECARLCVDYLEAKRAELLAQEGGKQDA